MNVNDVVLIRKPEITDMVPAWLPAFDKYYDGQVDVIKHFESLAVGPIAKLMNAESHHHAFHTDWLTPVNYVKGEEVQIIRTYGDPDDKKIGISGISWWTEHGVYGSRESNVGKRFIIDKISAKGKAVCSGQEAIDKKLAWQDWDLAWVVPTKYLNNANHQIICVCKTMIHGCTCGAFEQEMRAKGKKYSFLMRTWQ